MNSVPWIPEGNYTMARILLIPESGRGDTACCVSDPNKDGENHSLRQIVERHV